MSAFSTSGEANVYAGQGCHCGDSIIIHAELKAGCISFAAACVNNAAQHTQDPDNPSLVRDKLRVERMLTGC